MKLTPAMEQFVLHWGEMGARWGVNRSVAQIHALLYLADKPIHAEEIAESLGIARSNVSTSLKELQSWNLIQLVHLKGDRRDHFEAEHDCWTMLRRIVDGRKQREIDPTLTTLRALALEADADRETPETVKARIAELLAFMEQLDDWYRDMSGLDEATVRRLLRMGGSVVKLLPQKKPRAKDEA
jgi:DNA-binding transcriptional regulator GbsR (MarR family)